MFMKVPKRYEDLTVSQFQELEALKSNSALSKENKSDKRLAILSGEKLGVIQSLSSKEKYEILLDSIFLIEPLKEIQCCDSFWIGFKKFKYIKEISDYTTAQQIDVANILKANNGDYIKCLPELMALSHKELTLFGWKYKQENHQKNVELFKKSKLKDSFGAVFFYSKLFKRYAKIIADCLQKQNEPIQAHVKIMTEDKEFQTFLKTGGGNIL